MINFKSVRRFLDDLRVNGFYVGVAEEQKVVDLLLQLHNIGAAPGSTGQLCNLLGPVLCSNLEQQHQFRTRFDLHFLTAEPILEPVPPKPKPKPIADKQKTPLTLLQLWRLIPREERDTILKRAAIVLSIAFITIYVIPTILLVLGFLSVVRVDVPKPEPAPPIQRNSTRFGSGLEDAVKRSINGASQVVAGPRAAWRELSGNFGPFTFFGLSAPFVLLGMWIVSPGRQPGVAYLSRRVVKARPKFTQLLVSMGSSDVLGERASARRLQPLRQPRTVNSYDIDVDACIPRMLDNGGFFEPVYRSRLVTPEYLILADRRSSADHVFQYSEALVKALQIANVYADLYWFDRDPRRLFRSRNSPSLSLEEVAGRHGEHRLILIASGERLFDWVSGLIEPWTSIFLQFPRRVMLTPVSEALWGYRESAIYKALKMPVLPLTPAAIERLVEALASEDPDAWTRPLAATSSTLHAQTALADLLEESPLRWVLADSPTDTEKTELMTALKAALTPFEMHWLSVCAVYPQLVWKLTLLLGLTDSRTGERT
jgi:hypothetical protein